MRALLFGLGILLLILAAGTAVAELLHMTAGAGYRPVSLGSIWFNIHGNSLVGFQAFVEKGITPVVWEPIQFLITLSAWLVTAPIGLVLTLTCRPRQRGLGSRLG